MFIKNTHSHTDKILFINKYGTDVWNVFNKSKEFDSIRGGRKGYGSFEVKIDDKYTAIVSSIYTGQDYTTISFGKDIVILDSDNNIISDERVFEFNKHITYACLYDNLLEQKGVGLSPWKYEDHIPKSNNFNSAKEMYKIIFNRLEKFFNITYDDIYSFGHIDVLLKLELMYSNNIGE